LIIDRLYFEGDKMKINREDFLKQLESVLPGLSTKEIIEQSSCFIFKDKRVYTYNDEIACSQKSLLKIEGAVPAMPLILSLRKLKAETLEVNVNDDKSQLLIDVSKNERFWVHMEAEITLPVGKIDKPKRWKKLAENFADAISIVWPCAKDSSGSSVWEVVECVHIAPKFIEATDNHQVTRYRIKTPVDKDILLRKENAKFLIPFEMAEFSETKHWTHFRNADGLILSCRHISEDYLSSGDILQVLKTKGEPLALPKGLKETVEKAEIFSSENPFDDLVSVTLKKGKFRIVGTGTFGGFREKKKSKYKGKTIQFTIPPKLLLELVQHYNECEVTESRLKVKGSKFVYVTVLGVVEKKED